MFSFGQKWACRNHWLIIRSRLLKHNSLPFGPRVLYSPSCRMSSLLLSTILLSSSLLSILIKVLKCDALKNQAPTLRGWRRHMRRFRLRLHLEPLFFPKRQRRIIALAHPESFFLRIALPQQVPTLLCVSLATEQGIAKHHGLKSITERQTHRLFILIANHQVRLGGRNVIGYDVLQELLQAPTLLVQVCAQRLGSPGGECLAREMTRFEHKDDFLKRIAIIIT